MARPFAGGCLLACTNETSVDANIVIVRIIVQVLEDAFPDTVLGPACEALVHGLPFPIPLRKIVPVRAGTQNPEYPVAEIEVIAPRTAWVSDLAGQNARDPLPLVRRQFVAFGFGIFRLQINESGA